MSRIHTSAMDAAPFLQVLDDLLGEEDRRELCRVLIKSDAFIAGGCVLGAYTGFISRNIDIFVPSNTSYQLMNDVRDEFHGDFCLSPEDFNPYYGLYGKCDTLIEDLFSYDLSKKNDVKLDIMTFVEYASPIEAIAQFDTIRLRNVL